MKKRNLTDARKKQISRQNEFIKNNYDRFNLAFKKGIRDRIENVLWLSGCSSVNEFIRAAALEKLDKLERSEENKSDL